MDDQQSSDNQPTTDYGFIVINVLIGLVMAWLLLTPVMGSVARSGLRRFHLRSSSFVTWASQFPIPSMYNFANRYEVTDIPPGLIQEIIESDDMRYVNHFPSRMMTFADFRAFHLQARQERWLHLESSYRGQRLSTTYHLQPLKDGSFQVHRVSEAAE